MSEKEKRELIFKIFQKAKDGGSDIGEAFVSLDAYVDYVIENDFVPHVIFRHNFAKGFWGEWECVYSRTTGVFPKMVESPTQIGSGIPIWQLRLQEMVLQEDPIRYLALFLPKDEEEKTVRS